MPDAPPPAVPADPADLGGGDGYFGAGGAARSDRPGAGDDAAPAEHEALVEAERSGLRLAALARLCAIAGLLMLALSGPADPRTGQLAAAVLGGFALAGLAHLAVIGGRRDRPWTKYAAVAADYAALASLFAFVPVSLGGDTAQILAMRTYGALPLVLPLVLAALSLSPRLVLFAGACAAAAWWAAFLYITSGMERTLNWSDLPPAADAQAYYAVYLNPDFVAGGSRVLETLQLLTVAGVLALVVDRARRVLRERLAADAERAFLARTFGEYVPAEAARLILADREALAPRRRRATVLATDIAGFTAIAEARAPEDVIACLNAFFTDAAEAVAEEGGVIVDFSGDGFLAAFNAPIEVEDPEARALRAALALLGRAERRRYGGLRLNIRAGLATGELAAGSVGGAGRRTYTIYGDPVNLAARLQERGKTEGRALVADRDTAEGAAAAGGPTLALLEANAAIRGRAAPADLFALP